MSLLDPQARQELIARVQSENATESQPVSLEPSNVEPQQDAKPEESSTSQVNDREEKLVPYDRFKQVNDSKKEYKRKFDEQQRELERLRKELDGRGSKSEDDKWLEDLFADEPSNKNDPLKDIDARLRSFELQKAEADLDRFVDRAIKLNKDVDAEIVESVVYHVISQDPNADIEDVTEMLSNIKSLTTRFGGQTQDVNKKQPAVETKPKLDAPARLPMTGQKPQSNSNNDKPIRSVQEGSQRLLDFLRNNKGF